MGHSGGRAAAVLKAAGHRLEAVLLLPLAGEGAETTRGKVFLGSVILAATLVCLGMAAAFNPALAERRKADRPPLVLPPPTSRAAPAPPAETKVYDPQLMRLAEILGALTYLRGLCGEKDAATWRGRMQALLDAEGTPPIRKDRLAGAYNHGMEGYSLTYRSCTPNAHIVIDRFLDEGGRIAKDVENRYHAS